jgi:hypothetical protein
MIRVLSECGDALLYASEDLRTDKEVVLAALTSDADALEYACQDLRADNEVILAAVTKSGQL